MSSTKSCVQDRHWPTKHFSRVPVLSFSELDEPDQDLATFEYPETFLDSKFVYFDGNLMSISDFSKSDSPIFDGIMPLSAWSAYMIKLCYTEDGEEALICYRHFF